MKLNKISADMVSRRPDQTAEWLNRLARQVDIVETEALSASKKPGDLPIATTYSLGVVKIGQNLSITPEGVLSALAPTSYNYELLFNKPKINNVELIGNKSLSDLGIDIPTKTSELLNDGSDGTSVYVEADELATVATTGDYNDLLNTPTIGNATLKIQKNSVDIDTFTANATVDKTINIAVPTKTSDLQNDGSDGTSTYVEADELAAVATSGSYDDLLDKPTIGNATIKIQKNSVDVDSFTTNATANKTIDISVPTKTSDLTNDGEDGISPFVDATSLASDLALKQDKLIAGSNIQIAADGKTISATDTTYSAGNGLSLNGTTFSADTTVLATQTDLTNLGNTKQDKLTQTQLNAVNSGIDQSKVQQIATNTGNITSNTNRISTIEGKIPSAATSSNKLTDKDYVDNAVATNSANYISDNGQPFTSLADLEAYSGPLTNNDYAFVVSTDSQGNTIYTRYKYSASTQTWAEEYSISNPTFSSTQWAAIDSGVTANDVSQIATNKSDIASLQSGKQDKLSQTQLDAVNSGITAAKVTKLDGIAAGAEVNVQSDWNVSDSSSDAYIKNKPTIGNATLTIQRNGSTAQTFTANATSNKSVDIQAPVRVNLNGQVQTTSWRRSVIALCEVSTTNSTDKNSFSDGEIVLHRTNGLAGVSYIHVSIENQRENAYYTNFSYYGNVNLLASDAAIDTAKGFRPCTFKYDNKWYGGIEFYIAEAELSNVVFMGESNFAVFGLDYYSAAHTSSGTSYPGTVLNQEVYDSLNYSQWTLSKGTIHTDKINLTTGQLMKNNTYTATFPNKNGTVAMTSDIGNATLTIQKNGTAIDTFTANATSNKTINIPVPTKTSDIANDGADGTSTYVENDDLTTALAGKQDVLTAGTNIDITANTISTQTRGIEYIVGTQAAATNVWLGTSTDAGCSSGALYTGKTIVYHLPYAGTSSAATLNLTLPDGTTTGAKNVKYNTGGNVGTTYGAGCDIFMVYDGTYWKTSAWYDSNNYDRIRYNNSVKAAAAISSGGRVCVGADAGYIMAAANATFDITYPILYSGSAVNSGATNTNFYGAINGVNLSSTKSGWSGTQYKMTFLVGTLSGTTFTIGSDVFTQTVPTSEDGKIYAPLGIAYSTTNILFYPSNTYWAYKNGAFRPISHSEPVMTGADAGTAGTAGLVPAPAAGDNTKYLSGDGTWKTVSQYNLPIASASELGGVKIGSRLTINSSTGVLSADSQTDNNFTTTLKNKLDGIAAGAEVNVQSDWAEASNTSDAYIKNKPSLATVATSGSYNDLTNKPTIPAAQVNSDWNANSGVAQILNKPSLATVATSGSYNDLTNKPTIPTVNNATLTIQKNGSSVGTFTANASSNVTANITVPTKTSDITNDSGFITSSGTVAKADKLTTARTIAIGTGATGTATSFDGSSNITIPITNVKSAYVTWGGKDIVSNVSPDDAGCIDEFGHNKLAFLPANCIDVAYSTDGGSTWTDYGLSDTQKIAMVTTTGSGVQAGKSTAATASNIANLRGRIRIACGASDKVLKLYTQLQKILINFNTSGAGNCKLKIRRRTIANYLSDTDTWEDLGTHNISGWSGWNSYSYGGANFGGNMNNQTGQPGQIEFEFWAETFNSSYSSKCSIIDIRFIGTTNWGTPSEMARAGHIYTVATDQTTTFPNHVFPKNDGTQSLGDTTHRWKNLFINGNIYKNGNTIQLPSTAGTLALTSDIPTVNNATLTIQKNSTNVATFTANASSNVTANISVPTKTSELTNDSGFVTDTTSQDFAAQEGSTNPVFDDMTPIKTFTWTVADTTYRPVYQMENTGWAQDNMDITVAYRVTVTGTGISQVTDIIDRWFSPTNWPVTSIMARTLSTSGATTGYRYLRAVYPNSSGLNNNTYKIGQEISNYNATSRTIKVEVFKTSTGVTWNETKPAGPIYTSSTYQATNAMQPYATRGWIFRAPSSFNANSADAATRVSSYESATIASSVIRSGAALTSGYICYQATDGKVYMITNTTANMVCDDNARIGCVTTGYNANTAIDTRYFRSVYNLSSTQVGYIPHATIALGDRVYLRCTMDSSGNIHSDNYLATSMTAGYTWLPFGTATASNTIYMDVRKPMFYTLDSSGRLVRVNGKPTGIEQAAFVGNTLSPAPSTFVYTDNIANGAVTMDKVAKSEFLDFFYPVGSYYETSDVAFNPNNTWGGTWVEDTAGRVLVAKDSGTFDTVGNVGGVEQETHRHWQSGGSDTGSFYDLTNTAAASEGLESRVISRNRVRTTSDNTSTDGMRQTTTYDATTSALQPYIVVKRWHRTA